jgi:dynein heavy chain, axonemal
VSSKFIDEFRMACATEAKDALKLMMGHVHVYVTAACAEYFEKFRRHVYVTPKSYLSFIQGYKELYSKKWAYTQELAVSIEVRHAYSAASQRSPIGAGRQALDVSHGAGFAALDEIRSTKMPRLVLQGGLQKMFEAKADVNKMKAELAVKNQELAVAAKEAEALLKQVCACARMAGSFDRCYSHGLHPVHALVVVVCSVHLITASLVMFLNASNPQITESTAIAEKEKQKVAVIVDSVTKKAGEIAAVKDDAERDLAAAKPALDAALNALNRWSSRLASGQESPSRESCCCCVPLLSLVWLSA